MKLKKGRAAAAIAVLAVLIVSGVSCASKVIGNTNDSSGNEDGAGKRRGLR